MDRQNLIKKLKGLATGKKARWALATVFVVVAVAFTTGYWRSHPTAATRAVASETTSAEARPSGGWLQPFVIAFHTVGDKWAAINNALEDNDRLRLENTRLRLALEANQFDCGTKEASNRSHELGLRLGKDAGTRVARTMENIAYRPPGNVVPIQLYTLGVSYFKGHEDEKAAVIFTLLTGMEDNDSYKTAKNYLMTGVAWYRLDNLNLADQYFEKTLHTLTTDKSDPEEILGYQAQARLWRAIVAERLGNHRKSQEWLRDLVDHHPHSTEAAWVNPQNFGSEARRATASDE